jgi:hypothetical protein
MTTATKLIAEMADALYTLVPSCFCHAKHCNKCENWERAKKLVDAAGVFADLKTRRGSAGKIPPQGGSVNTPRPPQDTAAEKKVCRFVYRGVGKPDPIPEDAFSNTLADQLAEKPESLIACDGCGNMYSLIEIAIMEEETLCGICFHIRQRNEKQEQP